MKDLFNIVVLLSSGGNFEIAVKKQKTIGYNIHPSLLPEYGGEGM